MARHFKEQDIDEFRECFYLYARSGNIRTMDELTVIMRSLGMSPTITELKTYMKDKGGKVSFADFLDIMHSHTKKESIPKELLEAFREVDQIFREANIKPNGMVNYEEFVKIVCAPVPD